MSNEELRSAVQALSDKDTRLLKSIIMEYDYNRDDLFMLGYKKVTSMVLLNLGLYGTNVLVNKEYGFTDEKLRAVHEIFKDLERKY